MFGFRFTSGDNDSKTTPNNQPTFQLLAVVPHTSRSDQVWADSVLASSPRIERRSGTTTFKWGEAAPSDCSCVCHGTAKPAIPVCTRSEMEASRGLLELGTPGNSAFRLVNPVPRRVSLSMAKDPVIAPPGTVVPTRPTTPGPPPVSSYQAIPAIDLSTPDERSRARSLFLEPLAASAQERGLRIANVFAAVSANSLISPKRDDVESKVQKRRTVNSVTPKSISLAPIEEEVAMPEATTVSGAAQEPRRRFSKRASELYRSLHT